MPQNELYSLLHDAATSARLDAAAEVAEVLVALFGDVDATEETLLRVLHKRADFDRLFWDEVVISLAQIRG